MRACLLAAGLWLAQEEEVVERHRSPSHNFVLDLPRDRETLTCLTNDISGVDFLGGWAMTCSTAIVGSVVSLLSRESLVGYISDLDRRSDWGSVDVVRRRTVACSPAVVGTVVSLLVIDFLGRRTVACSAAVVGTVVSLLGVDFLGRWTMACSAAVVGSVVSLLSRESLVGLYVSDLNRRGDGDSSECECDASDDCVELHLVMGVWCSAWWGW